VNSPRIALLGAGGHARVLVETLASSGQNAEVVIASEAEKSAFNTIEFFSSDQDFIERYDPDSVVLVNGLGSVPGDNGLRKDLFCWYAQQNYTFLTVISPSAYVSPSALLGQGVQVNAGAIIQAGVFVGENCIVNTGAIIEHDCVIGDHCHVAPGTVLSGGVTLGGSVHVGTGARLIQGLDIGCNSVIGAGAVVTENISCDTTFVSRGSLAVRASHE